MRISTCSTRIPAYVWKSPSRWAEFCEIISHNVRYGMYGLNSIFWTFSLTHSTLSFRNRFFHLCILSTPIAVKRVIVVHQEQNANSVDHEETDHYEPSHLDIAYWQKYLSWSTWLKGLKSRYETLITTDSLQRDML